jgi:hypothetical protein
MTSRRDAVPFDPRHFEKLAAEGRTPAADATFREIYRRNHWAGAASRSGHGAGPDQTGEVSAALPRMLRRLGAEVLLDLPCGDYGWMRRIDLPVRQYIGADLLPELVEPLRTAFTDAGHRFLVLDLTRDPLPPADVLLCRDCLVHLSFEDIRRALVNVVQGPIRYLVTTTFPACEVNEDIVTGDWRPLDLERAPFGFSPPVELVNERCSEAGGLFADKSLGLWPVERLSGLPFLSPCGAAGRTAP